MVNKRGSLVILFVVAALLILSSTKKFKNEKFKIFEAWKGPPYYGDMKSSFRNLHRVDRECLERMRETPLRVIITGHGESGTTAIGYMLSQMTQLGYANDKYLPGLNFSRILGKERVEKNPVTGAAH